MSDTVPQSEQATESFGSRLKAAGQLAAIQAHRTKLTTLTLPAAYKALGRSLYGAKALADEFPGHYQEFDRLSDETKAIKAAAGNRPTAEGFAAKAKAAATAAKDMGQTKAIEMKVNSAFTKFGEAAFEKHGERSGPTELVQPILTTLKQIEKLDTEIARLCVSKPGQVLTTKRIAGGGVALVAVLIAILLFWPNSKRSSMSESGSRNEGKSVRQLFESDEWAGPSPFLFYLRFDRNEVQVKGSKSPSEGYARFEDVVPFTIDEGTRTASWTVNGKGFSAKLTNDGKLYVRSPSLNDVVVLRQKSDLDSDPDIQADEKENARLRAKNETERDTEQEHKRKLEEIDHIMQNPGGR